MWSPPADPRRLEPDTGRVFVDQNAARYKSFPLEPMLRAVYEVHPEISLDDVDVVVDSRTIGNLFDFVTRSSRNFEIDVEIIGKKAVFIRKERQTTEVIEKFRGFGHTFPKEYTRWYGEAKGSTSHHRVSEFVFAGLKYLLRFQSDCYFALKAPSAKKAPSARPEVKANFADTSASLSFGDTMTVGEKQPVSSGGLTVRKGGHEINQAATAEIKTRAAHRILDKDLVWRKLWMSQTPYLIAAYHIGGWFDDVQITDVRTEVAKWEERNSGNLRKLNTVIRHIIDTVHKTTAMKCRVRGREGGKLWIWELDVGYQCALPDDLCIKMIGAKTSRDEKK